MAKKAREQKFGNVGNILTAILLLLNAAPAWSQVLPGICGMDRAQLDRVYSNLLPIELNSHRDCDAILRDMGLRITQALRSSSSYQSARRNFSRSHNDATRRRLVAVVRGILRNYFADKNISFGHEASVTMGDSHTVDGVGIYTSSADSCPHEVSIIWRPSLQLSLHSNTTRRMSIANSNGGMAGVVNNSRQRIDLISLQNEFEFGSLYHIYESSFTFGSATVTPANAETADQRRSRVIADFAEDQRRLCLGSSTSPPGGPDSDGTPAL